MSRRPSRTKAGRLVPLPLPCAGPHHPAAIAPTAEIAQPPSLACGPPCSALSAVPWQAQGIAEPPHRALIPATEPPDHAHAWCSTRCRVPPRAESLAHGASPPPRRCDRVFVRRVCSMGVAADHAQPHRTTTRQPSRNQPSSSRPHLLRHRPIPSREHRRESRTESVARGRRSPTSFPVEVRRRSTLCRTPSLLRGPPAPLPRRPLPRHCAPSTTRLQRAHSFPSPSSHATTLRRVHPCRTRTLGSTNTGAPAIPVQRRRAATITRGSPCPIHGRPATRPVAAGRRSPPLRSSLAGAPTPLALRALQCRRRHAHPEAIYMWAARARNRALLSPLSSLHIARPPSPKTIAHTTLSLRLPRRGWHWSASVGQGDWAGRRASACTQPARNLTPENKWARNARTLTLTRLTLTTNHCPLTLTADY